MNERFFWAALGGLVTSAPLAAQGFQNEIQVFTQDVQKPGAFGLDLHLNSILQGPTPLPSDEAPFVHAVNTIAEGSLGIAPDLEVGLYVPVSWGVGSHDLFAGPEVRMRWVPVHPEDQEGARGIFLGANLALAWENQTFSQTRAQGTFLLIAGYQSPEWLFAVNPTFGWALSGDQRQTTPDFGSSWKLTWCVPEMIRPGLEFYADHGPLDRLTALKGQQQDLYATLDIDRKPWVFNIGVGRGLTHVSDRWTVKFVFELPL